MGPSARNVGWRRAAVVIGVAIVGATSVVVSTGGAASLGTDRVIGKTLVVDANFGLLSILDPHSQSPTVSLYVNHARFSTLLTFRGSDTKTPRPALATSYKASANGKVFTFQLRKGATFADGSPITSADVVFSLNRAYKFNKSSGGVPLMFPGPVTFKATGPYTVVITNQKPYPFTPAVVTTPQMSVINSKLARKNGATDTGVGDTATKWMTSGNSVGVSSGPYSLTSFTPNEVILTRNKRYWGTTPGYEKIVVRNVPSASEPFQVLRGDHELAIDVSASDAAKLAGSSKVRVTRSPSANLLLFFMNRNPAISPITANPKVQQAVRYAINYKRILDLAGPGSATPTGMLPSLYFGALPAKDGFRQDVARAKRLYAESGVTEPFTLNYGTDLTTGGVQSSLVAQSIKSDLDAAGIKVEIVGLPISTLFQLGYIEHKQAAGIFPTWPVVPNVDEIARWVPGGENNLSGMAGYPTSTDPSIAKLADQARATPGLAKRISLFQQAQKLLNQRGPWFPLLNPGQSFVSTRRVTGALYTPLWIIDLASLRPAGS